MVMWLKGMVLVLGTALVFSGCIMRPGPGSDPQNPTNGTGGAAAIVLQNNSGVPVCYVNFSSSSSSDWGGDQLGSSETIAPGANRSWSVAAGSYDVRAQDCNHGVLAERRNITVNGSTAVSVP